MKLATSLLSGLAIAGLLALPAAPAVAQGKKAAAPTGNCVDKGGRGWGGSTESARFQAWEAVLQATDWGMWAAWITSGAKVGSAAAGYSVSNVREKCSADGGSKVCVMRAKLCK